MILNVLYPLGIILLYYFSYFLPFALHKLQKCRIMTRKTSNNQNYELCIMNLEL